VYHHDAVEVLENEIADAALDEVRIYFPDPWHKKRHNKRRLVQPAFAALLVRKLAPDGRLHLATDWRDYAEHMWDVLDATGARRTPTIRRGRAWPATGVRCGAAARRQTQSGGGCAVTDPYDAPPRPTMSCTGRSASQARAHFSSTTTVTSTTICRAP